MSAPPDRSAETKIGVFDSGVGGLSVLRALRTELPQAALHYVADSAHAPYGDKSEDEICARSLAIASHLKQAGCQLLVVACNTATAAAVRGIRAAYPLWPIVGVEPGIKPAVGLTQNGKVGVMATTGTLRSERFKLLAQAHAAHIELVLQACPGLADAIETGHLDSPDIEALIQRYTRSLREAGVDTVVLGCTHYPFVEARIRQAMGPEVTLVDTAQAVARHTARQLPTSNGVSTPSMPRLQTTGNPSRLESFTRSWLDFPCDIDVQPLSI